MNEQELNKKLAKWAGFIPDYCDGVVAGWTYPNQPKPIDGRFHINDIPNFTQSLDTCFKWLVPRAIDEIMVIHDRCSSDVAYSLLFKWWLQELKLIIPGASLALCLAIEKLIDEEP